jgi:DNA topoisomerase-1
VDTIQARGYVATEKRFLAPTPLGEQVADALTGRFSFMDYDFTREMEESLDAVAHDKAEYNAMVGAAWGKLNTELGEFAAATGKVCPKCGKPMRRRVGTAKNGKGYDFWGCSGWPECKETL